MRRTFLTLGVFLGWTGWLALAQPPIEPPPIIKPPSHAQILDLHANVTHAAPSVHTVKGLPHHIQHVQGVKVQGAKVGEPLPAGHFPLAKLTLPGGTTKTLGAGAHHLSLDHQAGKWHVHIADAQGRVHQAQHVVVSPVQKGAPPAHTIQAGSLLFLMSFPVGFDPLGNPLYVTIGFYIP